MKRDMEGYSRSYHELPFEATQLEFRRRLVLEQIASHMPASVLEVGCGMLPLFLDLDAALDVTVIEPSAQFAGHARQLAQGRGSVRIVERFVEDVEAPLRDGGHDLIVVSSLLHEVERPERLLSALQRHCHERTVVHVNVPNALSLHRLLAVEMGLIDDPFTLSATQQRMQQHSTFDLDSLVALVESQGFEVFGKASYFIKPFTHAQMQALCDSGFMTPAMLRGLSGLVRHLPAFGSEIYVNARPRHA